MTDALFLADLPDPLPAAGEQVVLAGPEGRHAALVRRIRTGERIVLSDGAGRGVAGPVITVGKDRLNVRVAEQLVAPEPRPRIIVVQALAKGDRADLAVELLTETGADEIVPWPAERSIVRWQGERGERSRAKWQATAREAAKQSRRLRVPVVAEACPTRAVAARIAAVVEESGAAYVLHEAAARRLDAGAVTPGGPVLLVVGPEGGVTDAELAAFTGAGATPVLISDAVLRTSTAGGVATAVLRHADPAQAPT